MDFRYEDFFELKPSTGYETLIYDVLIGDPTLFNRADNIEAGWKGVQPILDAVQRRAAARSTPTPAGSAWVRRQPMSCCRRDGRALAANQRERENPPRRVRCGRDDGDVGEGFGDPGDDSRRRIRLRESGIHLALVSSRPPRGMMFLQRWNLGLTGPLGGFNGGTILAPDDSGDRGEAGSVPEAAVRITPGVAGGAGGRRPGCLRITSGSSRTPMAITWREGADDGAVRADESSTISRHT